MQTKRSKLIRAPQRGVYDREQVHAILDEGLVCHIGFAAPAGRPVVIPTAYGRDGNLLYIHGAASSRMMRTLATGVDLSFCVTLIDGLVLARAAFHHSVNYRSVVLFGTAQLVEDLAQKERALALFTDHVVPGRSAEVRPSAPNEIKATTVLALRIDEGSAKVRTGPPKDDEADYALDVWAGVLPCGVSYGAPQADPLLRAGIALAPSVRDYRRPG